VSSSTLPVRFPNPANRALMTRRAWWLVGLNLLVPGSAQVLAGNRRLGRFGLGATLVLWTLVVLGVLAAVFLRPVVYVISTNVIALTAVQILAVFYAVLWLVLTIDALRLVRIIRIEPSARALVAALAIIGMVAVSGTAAYGAMIASSTRGLLLDTFAGGQMADPIDGRYNILLLGGDAGPDRMGLRPDSISVVSVDAATGAVSMIGVPRNQEFVPFVADSPLYGPFPNGYDCGDDCLISYLYTYAEEHPELYPDAVANDSTPGIEATRDAVEGVLGLTMQYYVLIDMQGFIDLIDALGGIDITSQARYPIGGDIDANGQPINVGAWIEPGPQHMDGNRALWYARSRHGFDDFDRMRRQREVQDAMLTQLNPQNVLLRFQDIARAGAQVVRTDIPSGMLGGFVSLAEKAKEQPVASLNITPENGYLPGNPDYAFIQSSVRAFLYPPEETAPPA